MSYCRFSSDDFQCDVYVYADCMGGYTTHVAGNRIVYKKPLPPPVPFEDVNAYMKRDLKIMKMVDKASHVKIGLPCDGETYNDATPDECANRLESLKAMGYRVPQYAIDALREEAIE